MTDLLPTESLPQVNFDNDPTAPNGQVIGLLTTKSLVLPRVKRPAVPDELAIFTPTPLRPVENGDGDGDGNAPPVTDPPFEDEDYGDGLRMDDTDNVERLIALVGERLRFVHAWGKFLVYSDGVWHIDYGAALTLEMAKGVSQQLYEVVEAAQTDLDALGLKPAQAKRLQASIDKMESWAQYSAMRSGRNNMVNLTRGEHGVLIEHEQLETHPYLVNVANGTLDYSPVKDDPENGQPIFRNHNPEDLLLLKSPVAYDPDAECLLWEHCLEEWQPDPEVRDYLQMRAGACALGVPTETLDLDIGGGRNGKSKFHATLQHILGDYTAVPHKSLLMAQRFGEHDTVYADLFRKRMACATETKAGDSLDEESVKSLTGGDQIKARRMREDFWYYWPTHTLILYTNHRPRIKGTDQAIWDRVHLVDWNAYFAPGAPGTDPNLLDHLLEEAPGILNWLLEGVLMFLRRGWFVPEAVRATTEDYRSAEDLYGKFLGDCVEFTGDSDDWVYFSNIQSAAERWRMVEGLTYPLSQRNLTDGLLKGGATKDHDRPRVEGRRETVWHGLRLL